MIRLVSAADSVVCAAQVSSRIITSSQRPLVNGSFSRAKRQNRSRKCVAAYFIANYHYQIKMIWFDSYLSLRFKLRYFSSQSHIALLCEASGH